MKQIKITNQMRLEKLLGLFNEYSNMIWIGMMGLVIMIMGLFFFNELKVMSLILLSISLLIQVPALIRKIKLEKEIREFSEEFFIKLNNTKS